MWSGSGRRSRPSTSTPSSVTVHYQTKGGRYAVTGDYAVCSIPFSVLQTVEAVKPFSREKQRAIRQLNYAASTKILFQVPTPAVGGA